MRLPFIHFPQRHSPAIARASAVGVSLALLIGAVPLAQAYVVGGGSGPATVKVVSKGNHNALPGGSRFTIVIPKGKRGQAMRVALREVNTPYVWGGGQNGAPSGGGWDCSGLMQYAYFQSTGKLMERVAADQFQSLPKATGGTKPGDLLFFSKPSDPLHHVGMYLGKGLMLHAPQTGDKVTVEPLKKYLARGGGDNHTAGARRPPV